MVNKKENTNVGKDEIHLEKGRKPRTKSFFLNLSLVISGAAKSLAKFFFISFRVKLLSFWIISKILEMVSELLLLFLPTDFIL